MDPAVQSAQIDADRAAAHFRLQPWSRRFSVGLGQSSRSARESGMEFFDQREYQPGDDPRHINWSAYARTGKVITKLFEAESSPRLHVICDLSTSMTYLPGKRRRLFGLLFFLTHAARVQGFQVRLWKADPRRQEPWSPEILSSWTPDSPEMPFEANRAPAFQNTPGSPATSRIFISDLLYPEAPESVLPAPHDQAGSPWLIVPLAEEDFAPLESGLLTLRCVESGQKRLQFWDKDLHREVRARFERRLDLARSLCARRRTGMVLLPCEGSLEESFLREAVPSGLLQIA